MLYEFSCLNMEGDLVWNDEKVLEMEGGKGCPMKGLNATALYAYK